MHKVIGVFVCFLIAAPTVAEEEPSAKQATTNYFPLKLGSKWHYRIIRDGKVVALVVNEATEVKTVAGRQVVVLESRMPDKVVIKKYHSVSRDGVFTHLGGDGSGDMTCLLKYPPKKETWKFDKYKDAGLLITEENRGFEEVTVPAGRYQAILTETTTEAPKKKTTTNRTWFVDGIGVVKQTLDDIISMELEKFEEGDEADPFVEPAKLAGSGAGPKRTARKKAPQLKAKRELRELARAREEYDKGNYEECLDRFIFLMDNRQKFDLTQEDIEDISYDMAMAAFLNEEYPYARGLFRELCTRSQDNSQCLSFLAWTTLCRPASSSPSGKAANERDLREVVTSASRAVILVRREIESLTPAVAKDGDAVSTYFYRLSHYLDSYAAVLAMNGEFKEAEEAQVDCLDYLKQCGPFLETRLGVEVPSEIADLFAKNNRYARLKNPHPRTLNAEEVKSQLAADRRAFERRLELYKNRMPYTPPPS